MYGLETQVRFKGLELRTGPSWGRYPDSKFAQAVYAENPSATEWSPPFAWGWDVSLGVALGGSRLDR